MPFVFPGCDAVIAIIRSKKSGAKSIWLYEPLKWHDFSISDYSTWDSDYGLRVPDLRVHRAACRTPTSADTFWGFFLVVFLFCFLFFWLQESWGCWWHPALQVRSSCHPSIQYYEALLLQGFKLLFHRVKLHRKVNIWFCFAAGFMQRMNQYHQAMGMHLSVIILNYLLLSFPCQ